MHIVGIAWAFVVLLMAAAEATSSQGTLLGAFFTLLLYGVLPLAIVLYILGTPGRRRLRQQAQAQAEAVSGATATATATAPTPEPTAASAGQQHDGGRLAAGAPVAPVREEP